jgi:hypothetical protein
MPGLAPLATVNPVLAALRAQLMLPLNEVLSAIVGLSNRNYERRR